MHHPDLKQILVKLSCLTIILGHFGSVYVGQLLLEGNTFKTVAIKILKGKFYIKPFHYNKIKYMKLWLAETICTLWLVGAIYKLWLVGPVCTLWLVEPICTLWLVGAICTLWLVEAVCILWLVEAICSSS